MGNRMYRPYHARYSGEALRTIAQKEKERSEKNSQLIKLTQKTLYSTGSNGSYISFSNDQNQKKSSKIEQSLFIHRETLKITQDPNTSLQGLSFACSSLHDFKVSVFYFAKEVIDTAKKAQYISLDKQRSPKPFQIEFKKGANQEIFTSPVFDPKLFSLNELNFQDKQTFPIVIYLSSQTETCMYYFKIAEGHPVQVRENFTKDNRAYEILNFFGSLTEECVACYTHTSDIAVLPCRHLCLCEACFEGIKKDDQKCPICRSKIIGGCKVPG